jgi:hypothetical protein
MCLRDYCSYSGDCDRKFLGLFLLLSRPLTRDQLVTTAFCYVIFLSSVLPLFVHFSPFFLSLSLSSLFLCSFFTTFLLSLVSLLVPFDLSWIVSFFPLFLCSFLSSLLCFIIYIRLSLLVPFILLVLYFFPSFFSVCLFPFLLFYLPIFLPLSLTSVYPYFFPSFLCFFICFRLSSSFALLFSLPTHLYLCLTSFLFSGFRSFVDKLYIDLFWTTRNLTFM